MKARQLTLIAFMAASMVCVFQLFSNILYLEMITFTIVLYAMTASKKEAVLACVIFACLNMLFLGITPWTCMYLIIYPVYALITALMRNFLNKHLLCLCLLCGFLSFLCGQLLDLPFLLFSKHITLLYWISGLKTSLIQGILSFLCCLFLYEPLSKRIMTFYNKNERSSTKANDKQNELIK